MANLYYFSSTDDQSAINTINNINKQLPCNHSCFGGAYFMENQNWYCLMQIDPEVVRKFNNGMKKHLTNVSVIVVDSFTYCYVRTGYGYWKQQKLLTDEEKARVDSSQTRTHTLFSVRYNENYSNMSKHILHVLVGELLRTYNPEYSIYSIRGSAVTKNYYKEAIKINHENRGGTALITPFEDEEVLRFNDIELMNTVFPNIDPSETIRRTIPKTSAYPYTNYGFYITSMIAPTPAMLALRNYVNTGTL